MMLDIDLFKQYNDAMGHQKGDEALCKVAAAMKAVCRRSGDLVFRMGGEEMALLANFNNESEALHLAEHLREQVLSMMIHHPFSPYGEMLTVSIGVALFDARVSDGASLENVKALYSLADKALYDAKAMGRNRVVQSPSFKPNTSVELCPNIDTLGQ